MQKLICIELYGVILKKQFVVLIVFNLHLGTGVVFHFGVSLSNGGPSPIMKLWFMGKVLRKHQRNSITQGFCEIILELTFVYFSNYLVVY